MLSRNPLLSGSVCTSETSTVFIGIEEHITSAERLGVVLACTICPIGVLEYRPMLSRLRSGGRVGRGSLKPILRTIFASDTRRHDSSENLMEVRKSTAKIGSRTCQARSRLVGRQAWQERNLQ